MPKENEYRCQNSQCIPLKNFHDRSDETSFYLTLCSIDPSFRCEDFQCRPSSTLSHVCENDEYEDTMDESSKSFILIRYFQHD